MMTPACFSTTAARRGFGLGFSAGLLLACAGFAAHGWLAGQTAGAAVAAATSGGWRHPAASSDLESAVQLSARMLRAAPLPTADPKMLDASDDGVRRMLDEAAQHRRKREFDKACALYALVAAQGAMTADAWADYADAQATLAGRLDGAPEQAIDAALALEPAHPKALWLRASLAHEQHRYQDALAAWRRLLAVVPPGSNDARIIEANIAEAARLAAG